MKQTYTTIDLKLLKLILLFIYQSVEKVDSKIVKQHTQQQIVERKKD